MEITFLGTGTSQGVPIIACNCEVCFSKNSKDKRLRSSIHIQINDKSIVIDSGPDFRYQMLRENIKILDALIFTHEHKDHTGGLDDIRPFNYFQNKDLNVYAHPRVQASLKKQFDYIFANLPYPGIPKLILNDIVKESPFYIDNTKITPIEVLHYKLPVLGFRIGDFTYITDANAINDSEIAKIKGSKILVLNALRKEEHISHFTLKQAIQMAEKIGADQTYFTHISHQLGTHADIERELPNGINLAFDGMKIQL